MAAPKAIRRKLGRNLTPAQLSTYLSTKEAVRNHGARYVEEQRRALREKRENVIRLAPTSTWRESWERGDAFPPAAKRPHKTPPASGSFDECVYLLFNHADDTHNGLVLGMRLQQRWAKYPMENERHASLVPFYYKDARGVGYEEHLERRYGRYRPERAASGADENDPLQRVPVDGENPLSIEEFTEIVTEDGVTIYVQTEEQELAPEDDAALICEIRRTCAKQIAHIQNDPTLSDAQKRERIKAARYDWRAPNESKEGAA